MAAIITMRNNADFVADREKARAELKANLATSPAPDAKRCTAEAKLIEQTLW
jgi:hypothetical protein